MLPSIDSCKERAQRFFGVFAVYRRNVSELDRIIMAWEILTTPKRDLLSSGRQIANQVFDDIKQNTSAEALSQVDWPDIRRSLKKQFEKSGLIESLKQSAIAMLSNGGAL